MSAEASAEAGTEANASSEAEDGTELAEPFIAEASGTVRRRRYVEDDMVETTKIKVAIQREITTAEEFNRWHKLHESGDQVADAIEILLEDHDEYRITRDALDSWQVCIDGSVAAYRSAAEEFQDHDKIRWTDYTSVTHECASCYVFGVGARIAELDARRGAGDSIDSYLQTFAEEREINL